VAFDTVLLQKSFVPLLVEGSKIEGAKEVRKAKKKKSLRRQREKLPRFGHILTFHFHGVSSPANGSLKLYEFG
jgi:hypothetical protein